MLVLSRKPGEEVVVGDNIRLTVVEIHGNQVRLGITAPAEIPIRRQELPCHAEPLGKLPPRPVRPPACRAYRSRVRRSG
jgi:carbon storage regulator